MRLSTESLALAAARRPWRTLAAWGAVLAAAAATASLLLGSGLTTEADVTRETESKRAARLIERRFGPRPDLEQAIVRSRSLTVEDPAFVQALRRLARGLRARQVVVAPDGRAALLSFELGPRPVEEALAAVRAVGAHPALEAALYGPAVVDRDFNRAALADLRTAETFGVAAALVVLLLVFGALPAALLPLALSAAAVGLALGLAALLGLAISLSIFVVNMIAGMGLALGVDYSLFILARFREERGAGREVAEAVAAAGATAGRTVLVSGATAAVASLGIAAVPDSILRSLGIGAVVVAACSVAVALTLLPAVLALLGDRVDLLRLPLVGARGEPRFWAWAARRVMRRPLVSLLLVAALLLAAAAPVLGLRTGRLGVSTLPERLPARQGYDLLRETFGYGRVFPTRVVVPPDRAAAAQRALAADPRFGPPAVERSPDGAVVVLAAPLRGDPLSEEAFAAVRALRERLPPGALVSGVTAGNLDYVEATNASRPFAFGAVLGLSFLVLLAAFRSLVVPVKAVLLNLLSVGAAYGLMVAVFQHGAGAGLLGFQRVEAIEVWVPVFLFAILFALSLDYHVFLLSRVRERYAATNDNEGAVAFGVASTGRIITGAALIIVVVFIGLALGELVYFQQMGLGVAAALLLDATLVRSVLVPAAMKLLGRWNWYLPGWLRWLPAGLGPREG